jgi:hypothetical protein
MWEYINGFLKGNPQYSLHLLGALKINGNEATGLEPFILKLKTTLHCEKKQMLRRMVFNHISVQ